MIEQPHFFVGLICYEFFFQFPLILLNLNAILSSKPWFKTTCLVCGVALSSAMAGILSEMVGSRRASAKLLTLYVPVMVLGMLATLRGLLSHSVSDRSLTMSSKKLA
ncbi:hypothetical protein K1719_026848 [Acacia pycnantha]|nr:hypothetical protein K1719_026848 [Acacia pycnantha]